MKVQDNAYVAIEYRLTLDSGETVDQSEPGDPLGFVFGTGQIVPGLERALEGVEAGHRASVVVEAEEAYGPQDPAMIRQIPIDDFPAGVDVQPGMVFEAEGQHGPMTFRVTGVEAGRATADFNHPLAGERLHFDVHVVEVREATEDELSACSRGCAGDCSEGCCG